MDGNKWSVAYSTFDTPGRIRHNSTALLTLSSNATCLLTRLQAHMYTHTDTYPVHC